MICGQSTRPNRACLCPQGRRDGKRIETELIPPFRFIATAVDLPMVGTAERHRELIAHLASELRLAQSTDASADVRPAISARSCSRTAADLVGSRIGALMTERAFPLRPKAGRRGSSIGWILPAGSVDRVADGFRLLGPLRS